LQVDSHGAHDDPAVEVSAGVKQVIDMRKLRCGPR
jgi:hypothetical protein